MRLSPSLPLLLLALLLAQPALAEFRDIEGKASYSDRSALPPDSVLEVQLLEIAGEETAPLPIASINIRTRGASPFPFRLVYDDGIIDRTRRYALAARIHKDGETLYQNANATPMFTGIDAGPPLILMVRAEPPGGPPQPSLELTEWILSELVDGDVVNASPARLRFGEDSKLSGHGGCNDFTSDFRVEPPKGLSIGKIAATLRGCSADTAQQERLVFRAIEKVRNYQIEGGDLILMDEADAPLLRFQQSR